MTERVSFIDTTVRDGNQSLWGATGLTTSTVLEIAPVMDQVGYSAVDFTSSTHMAVSVRTHRENPWERIRLARAAMPRTPLSVITTGMRFVSWEPSPEAVMRLAFSLFARNGIRRIQILEPMHDMEQLLRAARTAREEGLEQVVAALCYSISPVHTDQYYAQRAALIRGSPLIDVVYLKDPGGLLTPERVRSLVPTVREQLPGMPLEIHSHCNTGLAPACYIEAVRLGVRAVHTAVAPLANGTSQPSAERTMANLRALGYGVDLDSDALARTSEHFRGIARRTGRPVGVPVEYDVAYYQHQVPGGMMSTLSRQLAELGMEDRLPQVLEEIPRVRQELGYPIMVTPFSQFVGTQAVLNIAGGKGRYGLVADEIAKYVLGHYGKPPAPIEPEVGDRVLSLPRTKELDKPPPQPSVAELRGRFGVALSDEELLLRAVLTSDQVDAMKAGARQATAPAQQVVDGEPIKRLIEELARRPSITHIRVEKDGFSLTLRQRQENDAGAQ